MDGAARRSSATASPTPATPRRLRVALANLDVLERDGLARPRAASSRAAAARAHALAGRRARRRRPASPASSAASGCARGRRPSTSPTHGRRWATSPGRCAATSLQISPPFITSDDELRRRDGAPPRSTPSPRTLDGSGTDEDRRSSTIDARSRRRPRAPAARALRRRDRERLLAASSSAPPATSPCTIPPPARCSRRPPTTRSTSLDAVAPRGCRRPRVGAHDRAAARRHAAPLVRPARRARKDRLALLITREMGKPLAEAYGEVQYGADFVRWYAEEACAPAATSASARPAARTIVTPRAPVGLAVLITPWNFPLAMATRKIAPALAAGCPRSSSRPSSRRSPPSSSCELARARPASRGPRAGRHHHRTPRPSARAHGRRARAQGVVHRLDRRRQRAAAPGGADVLKRSMELGGNAPLLVFDDADLERAVEGAVVAKMRNGGQSCIAANRIHVQDGIADAFVEGFTERLRRPRVGNGSPTATRWGRSSTTAPWQGCSDSSTTPWARARRCAPAASPRGRRALLRPTVLDQVPDDAEVAQTGDLRPDRRRSSASATRTRSSRAPTTREFGLAGYVFTRTSTGRSTWPTRWKRAWSASTRASPPTPRRLSAASRQSGLGREGGAEGLEEYQEIRYYNLARRGA